MRFRAVSSIQVILEFCFSYSQLVWGSIKFLKKEKESSIYFENFCRFRLLIINFFTFKRISCSFSGPMDELYSEGYGPILMEQILSARKQIYNYDLTRAIVYCLLISIIYLLFHFVKIGKTTAVISLIAIVLIDLIEVSNRYINREMFVSPRKKMTLFQPRSKRKLLNKRIKIISCF